MIFTKNSVLVKIWVSLVLTGEYEKEDVPRLFNLRSVVYVIIDGLVAE